MIIYTYWEPGQAELFRLWDRSWRARGWKTRILTTTKAKKISSYPHKLLKIDGWLVSSLRVINFSLKARGQLKFQAVYFNKPGWEKADLVIFDTEQQALDCGRKI
jgi:hypothetical protein